MFVASGTMTCIAAVKNFLRDKGRAMLRWIETFAQRVNAICLFLKLKGTEVKRLKMQQNLRER